MTLLAMDAHGTKLHQVKDCIKYKPSDPLDGGWREPNPSKLVRYWSILSLGRLLEIWRPDAQDLLHSLLWRKCIRFRVNVHQTVLLMAMRG